MKNYFTTNKELPAYFRIGLVGPASSGKTTLAERLSERLGYNIVVEGVREYCQENNLSLDEARTNDPLKFQWDVMKYRREQIQKLNGEPFISDRTPIDNFLYLALYYPDTGTADELRDYLNSCINELNDNYDLIIMVPEFKEWHITADGFRTTNVGKHVIWELALRGLLTKLLVEENIPRIEVIESKGLDDRVNECVKLISNIVSI